MPLDGLRAWIGEVERKLGMRTRVFLVLATIAIGGAGAAIYLALDTRDDAVSESDVQALQGQLEDRVATGGATGTGADLTQLEAEVNALEAEVKQLRGESGASKDGGAAGSGGIGTGTDGASGGTGGAAIAPDEADGATGDINIDKVSKSKLRDLLEQAKKENERAEEEAAEAEGQSDQSAEGR